MSSKFTHRQLLLLADLGLISVATVCALVLRDNLEVSADRLWQLLPYLGTTLGAAVIIFPLSGGSYGFWRFSAMTDYLRIVVAVAATVITAVALHFLLDRMEGLPRALPPIQALLMAFLLIGSRVAARLRHYRRGSDRALPAASKGQECVLVVGINTVTDLFLRSVTEFAGQRISIAGIVGRNKRHSGRRLHQHPILGLPEDIADILRTLEVHGVFVDRIVVTLPFSDLSAATQAALLEIEKNSSIQLDFFAERLGLVETREVAAKVLERSPDDTLARDLIITDADKERLAGRTYFKIKRIIDVVVATVVLIVGAPIIIVIGMIVAIDVGLPVIFWQQRPGVGGQPFRVYKFRTMRGAHNRAGGRIPDEDRLSAIGRFLRRSRLDELPQLFQILAGKMSFVGPRPLLPIDQPEAFAGRLLVRPGLTGWAQVAGGRSISARDKAALDIWYVRNASPMVDLKVIWRTLPMLIFGERLDVRAVNSAWSDLRTAAVAWQVEPGTAKGQGSFGAGKHAA